MDTIANVARGTIFGAALTLSGVYLPSVIIGQLEMRDFHMLQAFLTASATSAIVLAFSKSANKPRASSNLGFFGPYDGNIIGGAMVGAGMALTGACPGTVLVQIATGVPSAFPVLLGGLIGGALFVKLSHWLKIPKKSEQLNDADLTIPSKLQIDPLTAVMAYDGLLSTVILAASMIKPRSARLFNPVLGGLAIGAAQLASVILTQDAIGTSTAYEEVGKWFFWLTSQISPNRDRDKDKEKKVQRATSPPSSKAIVFTASILLGSYVFSKLRPDLVIAESMPISSPRGFLGGLVMILGARLANGCTSGHGISGMSVLSIASVYTVAAMFGGGIALAFSLRV